MLLSPEQKEMVAKNRGFVHYIVSDVLKISPNKYDDMVSIGMIGLCKAVSTFNPDKCKSFAIYARKVIVNEIFMQLRKYKYEFSNPPVSIDSFEDLETCPIMVNPNSLSFVERIENQETICQCLSCILNYSIGNDFSSWVAVLYSIAGYSQNDIAEALNFTQSYISQLIRKSLKKLELDIKHTNISNSIFSVAVLDGIFQITFSTKKLIKVKKIISYSCSHIDYLNVIYSYYNNSNTGQVKIYLFADEKSFCFLGDILLEFHENNIFAKKSEK